MREISRIELDEEDDFVIAKGDITGSFVSTIPVINFSERVHQFIIKDIANTMVIKLLGRNIGYVVLQNKMYSLWKPSKPFQLMDIENDNFLLKAISGSTVVASGDSTTLKAMSTVEVAKLMVAIEVRQQI
ncbi:hypothetical protein Goari_025156 [Gossypium aridum]|uniref:Uncharacterized protein n=1 Tax=Gossypium aridum TaxID=34290 RepID=A0A7J8X8A2_GOSAI|nr:hypothetical protein [Gossypium aridum]